MTSVIFGTLLFFSDTWKAANQKLELSAGFLSMYEKYKQVWDFGSNNGFLVITLKSLVNQDCMVKKENTKIHVADSNSVLFIICAI